MNFIQKNQFKLNKYIKKIKQMITKTNFITLIIAGLFSATILISCESHEQKADDAFELVKEEKMLSSDINIDSPIVIQESIKTDLVKKNDSPDEWTLFKVETEKKIFSNESKIKEIKGIPNADTKLFRRVASLEKDNNDLRIKMDEYKGEEKARWENFKTMVNHDANEIGIELKDIKINNKK